MIHKVGVELSLYDELSKNKYRYCTASHNCFSLILNRDGKLGFSQPRFLQVFRKNLNILNGLKKVFLGFSIFFFPQVGNKVSDIASSGVLSK